MSKSELHFLGHIIDLLTVETNYNKPFHKYKGNPDFYNEGGLLKVTFGFGENYRFLERMTTVNYELYKRGYPLDDGKIVFYDANGDSLKTWHFQDAAIVFYKVVFDSNGGGMIVEMLVSPAIQNYGAKIHRWWHVSPIEEEEEYKSPIQASEGKKETEIIEGWWSSDFEGNNKINEGFMEETVYFQIKTKNVDDGQKLHLKLKDQGEGIFDNSKKISIDYTTEIKDNKATISLKLNSDWNQIFANENDINNLRIKLSWEATLNDNKKILPVQETDLLELKTKGDAFVFIIGEEFLPSEKLVRKVKVYVPKTESSAKYLKQFLKGTSYEYFGMQPKAINSTTSIAGHVADNNPSKFLSASTLDAGANTIQGSPHYIDKVKFEKSGGKIYTTNEIITHLKKYKEELITESAKARIEKVISVVKNTESEVLLEGNVTPDMVMSKSSMRLVKGLRVVSVVGIVLSAYELGKATNESIEKDSSNPIIAETIRQAGGWGGAIAGTKIGASAGAAIGLATGPGAILCGAAGALIFGTAGYFGADWIADHINEN